MSTNRACARGPNRWISRATRPLPLPVSPWIRMRGGRDARAHARRSLSTCPRTSTIAGLSPSSSAPSVTRAPPRRSDLAAALRDRPRELADQPRIALLDDLEAVIGVLDRALAGPLLIEDLDDALVPPEEAPAKPPPELRSHEQILFYQSGAAGGKGRPSLEMAPGLVLLRIELHRANRLRDLSEVPVARAG